MELTQGEQTCHLQQLLLFSGVLEQTMGNHLYLTEDNKRVILRIHFESQTAKTIIGQNVQWPYGIVVDHQSK